MLKKNVLTFGATNCEALFTTHLGKDPEKKWR